MKTIILLGMFLCISLPAETLGVMRLMGIHGGGTAFQTLTPSRKPILITNAHVCDFIKKQNNRRKKDQAFVQLEALDLPFKVLMGTKILYISNNTDLCFLEPIQNVIPFFLADVLHPQEPVHFLGYPQLHELTISFGRLQEPKNITIENDKHFFDCTGPKNHKLLLGLFCENTTSAIRIDAPCLPGNSGSPVLNESGQVVGIIFAKGQNDSYMISVRVIKKELKLFEKSLSDVKDYKR